MGMKRAAEVAAAFPRVVRFPDRFFPMLSMPDASVRSARRPRVGPGLAGVLLFGTALLGGCDLAGSDTDASAPADPPRPLTANETQVVEADNAFGLSLFRETVRAENGGTVLLSPLSVSMVLGMTLNGARGDTRTAMETALRKQDLAPAEINDAYRGLLDLLTTLDPSVEVSIATSIWHDDVDVKQPFIDTNREHFDAEVAGLDFADPSASDRINTWVADATGGNIDAIVPGRIPDHLRMYLVNATYFAGDWRVPFDPADTRERPFIRADGSTVSVPMMERTESVTHPFYRTDAFTAVDVAYGDSLYAMTLLVPRGDNTVQGLVDTLDTETWARITDRMSPRSLSRLQIPKFTLEYERSLPRILRSLGMGIAFSDDANFRDIADANLAIDDVKHKTTLRVDEEGAEASAATAVGIGVVSVPPEVIVDRPFVVAIRENHSGTILFLGTVMDPTA